MQPTILLVDDEKKYCEVVGELLEAYGFEVLYAYDAGDALFRLKASMPDLILMDVMMPEVDGLTLIGRLRISDEWARVPILVVSAKSQDRDREAALGAGANAFLPKPFTEEKLRNAIAEFFPKVLH